jgi:hypothetical protein
MSGVVVDAVPEAFRGWVIEATHAAHTMSSRGPAVGAPRRDR